MHHDGRVEAQSLMPSEPRLTVDFLKRISKKMSITNRIENIDWESRKIIEEDYTEIHTETLKKMARERMMLEGELASILEYERMSKK